MVSGGCFGNHVPRQPAIPSELPVLPGMSSDIIVFNSTALCQKLKRNLDDVILHTFTLSR